MDYKLPLTEGFRFLKIIKSDSNNYDLSNIEFVTPFVITPISAYLKENRTKIIILPKDNNASTYLDFISFPKGISVKNFKEMNDTKTYFPIFCFSNDEIKNGELLDKFTHCLETFANITNHKDLIYQPLDELVDNIREHAFSKSCFIHAQVYSQKYLAISIVDIGKTIPQSYIEAGFKLEKESEAFEYILSGISSTKDPTRGYGLNSNINIISSALKGSIVIISGKAVVSKIKDEKPSIFSLEDYNLEFKGTVVNILFEIPKEKLSINPYDYLGKKKTYID